MIQLTRNETKWYVNPEQIIDVAADDKYKQTLVQTTREAWYVSESPEEVAKKVLNYKVAMIQYQTYLARDTENREWTDTRSVESLLKRLAGLEDEGDD